MNVFYESPRKQAVFVNENKEVIMTNIRKISIINLIIYLTLFVCDIIFIGALKDEILEIVENAFGSGDANYAGLIAGIAVLIAVVFLVLCGILVTVNILLKIFQISFDKWGFSVPSIVLNCLTVIWTGGIGVCYLSGNIHNIAFICLGIMMLEMAALVLECVAVAKRKQA